MSSGVAAIIPRTGPGLGPLAAHDNGVPGATHRWVARAEGIETGESFSILHDLLGATRLKPTSGTGALPTATAVGELDQSLKQSTATPRALLGTLTMPPVFTFAMVCRTALAGADVSLGFVDGYRFSRAVGDGRFRLNASTTEGGAPTGFVSVNHNTDGFTVLVGICAGAASVFSSGEIKSSNAGTIVGRNSATTAQARIGSVSTVTDLEVLEMNAWPFAFTDAQRSAHINAMIEAHPEALA